MTASTPQKSVSGLFLEPRHLATVQQILSDFLPGVHVWVFGSRATGRNLWRGSDLDLAVNKELDWTRRGLLEDAFDESSLPMKVDIIDVPLVDKEFMDRIRRDFIPVQVARGATS